MDIKERIKHAIENNGADMEKLSDLFSLVRHCEEKDKRREWLLYVRSEARKLRSADAYELIRKTYVQGGQDGSFDDYCIALEWYRSPEKRFYLPRRSVLKPLVDDLQDLFDGKLDFLGVSLPPRVGKSTLCIFFMTFIMGHRPAAASVMSGHSDKLTDGFYRELLSIITDETQYRWCDVFPGVKLVDNSAKNETIDLERTAPNLSPKKLYAADRMRYANNINAYLLDAPNVFIESQGKPLCSVPAMCKGSQPTDGGNLIIKADEYEDFLKQEPNAKPLLKPFLGGDEFLNGKKRWCLWLANVSPKDLRGLPSVKARIEAVREFRLSSKKEATRKWAEMPSIFTENRQPETMYIAIPEVSSGNLNRTKNSNLSIALLIAAKLALQQKNLFRAPFRI